MCSRRFLPTLGLSVVLCCVAFGGYYSFLKATIDGGYTEWSVWSNCSKDCGEGFQTRYRNCAQPPPGRYGKDCYRFGPNNDKKPCFLKICPIDGKFSEWSSFSACDRSCGGGKQFRTRQCNNPPAVFEGKPCEGPSRQEQLCNTHECPIDGGYTQWSEYGPCSVTCGEGVKTRRRTCSNPPPSKGGKPCTDPAEEYTQCGGPCPVDGGYTEWTEYGPCSVTCGKGTRIRTRTCTNPRPSDGGKSCDEPSSEYIACDEVACPAIQKPEETQRGDQLAPQPDRQAPA